MSHRLLIITLMVFAALCLGCSASPEVYIENITFSRGHAKFFGLLVLFSALIWIGSKRTPLYPLSLLGLFILHPAWWQGVSSGDCGFGKADNSYSLSVLGVLLIMAQLLHLPPPKVRRTLLISLSLVIVIPLLLIGISSDPVQPAAEVALLDAAAAGDLPKVKSLVEQGVPIDARRLSNPPTRWKPIEDMQTRLRFPDYPFQRGYTPLMLSCIGGHFSTAEFLLEHGADVKATERDGGDAALNFAERYGRRNLIPLLVKHGATR